MHDKRLTTRLQVYWESIRKERPMPDIVWFNNAAIHDIWDQCFKLKVEPAGIDKAVYYYDYMGQSIIEAYGKSLTGQTVHAASKAFPGARIISKIDTLITKPEVLLEEGSFVNTQNKVVKFRSCLLPFGKEDGQLTHVIGGVSWKAF